MVHASLFSGIGGPEVSAAMLGWDNAFHCEINPFGRAVLEYWFPESKSYEDITKTDFREWRGKIDVLTGGFPCQPFSYAGKRGGREDERYLWPQMLRAIDEIRPTWVVGENVAGITTMVEGGILTPLGCDSTLFGEGDGLHRYELRQTFTIERICRDLEGLGYSVQPVLIPAAAVGAPHRRDRIFILAHVADTDCGDDLRSSGENEGKGKGKGLSERHSIRESGESNQLRSEIQGIDAHSNGGGYSTQKKDGGINGYRDGQIPLQSQRGKQTAGHNGLPPIQRNTTNANGSGQSASASDSGFNREKEVEGGECNAFAGTIRPCPSRTIADSYGQGREESQQPGRGENCEENGAGMDDRTERSGGNGVFADPGLLPENRWAIFPTVSPVHAGNDGLPIRMDGISIPFTKWRTEALKAYGNAIVPQVMYRIFQAIEQS